MFAFALRGCRVCGDAPPRACVYGLTRVVALSLVCPAVTCKSEIESQQRITRQGFETLCNLIPELKDFSYDEYLEVNSLINSRMYKLRIGNRDVNCLVPFADMFNHSNEPQVVYLYDKKKDSFIVKAINHIP